MRVIEPHQFKTAHHKHKRKSSHVVGLVSLVLVLVVVLGGGAGLFVALSRTPTVAPSTVETVVQKQPMTLPWPSYGQSAIGAVGYGLLDSSGDQKQMPTASVAKLMTALVVLRLHPLAPGQQGPTITMNSNDVAIYNDYVARDGSVVKVTLGENITEYQALQAVMLPSANNMADTLAIWATGSMDAYLDYANQLAKSLGMTQSNFTSASGFDPKTVSTAADLVTLGTTAMNNPVIADIVNQKDASIPVAGTVSNVNFLLGTNGIVGIKTGNTDEAGGCYLFAAAHEMADGQKVTVVGAIMGAPHLGKALQDSVPLITAAYSGFTEQTIAKQGQTVGYYTPAWGAKVAVTAGEDLKALVWKGSTAIGKLDLTTISGSTATGQPVGTVSYGAASVPAVLEGSVPQPSKLWQATHILSDLH